MFTDAANPAPRKISWVPIVFTATILLSAALLFMVQPLFTRMALPRIGGAPAVWTTAMLFFQTVLLVGYLYAHVLTRHVPLKAQALVHLALWAAALFCLPLAVPSGWQYDPAAPVALQTLALYAIGVGIPFAFLSANAPLIQNWYAHSNGPSADDPYFLYAASNFGSLVALLAFPLVAEPIFGMSQISSGWMIGFAALGGAMAACAVMTRPKVDLPTATTTTDPVERIDARRIARWLLLAFVPSSLMLSVTTKASIDIGSFPLVWVVPLSLYLLTFVLTFSNTTWFTHQRLRGPALVALCLLTPIFLGLQNGGLTLLSIGFLGLLFFAVALFGHALLYADRPDGAHLTIFYLVMSVGGALGGVFNSLVAPNLFPIFLEGSVTLIAACALFAFDKTTPRSIGRGVIFGLTAYGLALFVVHFDLEPGMLRVFVVGGALAAFLVASKSDGLQITIAVVLLSCLVLSQTSREAVFLQRGFFGIHFVKDDAEVRIYRNGTTLHGGQRIEDLDVDRPLPIFYYHPKTPMGQIVGGDRGAAADRIGVVGLGVGSLACYARPDQDWHFFEIDPLVDELARTPSVFSFLDRCAPEAPTHLGDARLVLETAPAFEFDILVIDAYSSDAVPVHLTTREAIEIYLSHLAQDGLLVFHISNRYYDITLPLTRAADALGVVAFAQAFTPEQGEPSYVFASEVLTMAQSEADIARFDADPRWVRLSSDGKRLWTDDFANPLSILK